MEVHLHDVLEVAAILHVSRSYAYLLIRRGDIASFRLGVRLRVHPADLQAYLDRRRRPLPQPSAGSSSKPALPPARPARRP